MHVWTKEWRVYDNGETDLITKTLHKRNSQWTMKMRSRSGNDPIYLPTQIFISITANHYF